MQTVQLYREIENYDEAMSLLEEGLQKFKDFHKLWLIKAQIYEHLNDIDNARKVYEEALLVDSLKSNKLIWLTFADFEER